MKKKRIFVSIGALALGAGLHFLHELLPSPLTALISPVRESLWEHIKILFYPLLLSGLVMARGDKTARCAWRLSALTSSMLMLGVAYVYHILLRGDWMVFDLTLYAAAMALGFLLPGRLWSVSEKRAVRALALLLCLALTAALMWWSFSPPERVIFADLSEGVRTFLTIPV